MDVVPPVEDVPAVDAVPPVEVVPARGRLPPAFAAPLVLDVPPALEEPPFPASPPSSPGRGPSSVAVAHASVVMPAHASRRKEEAILPS
jgi:hypothetical protein